ncbi:MAG: hypothetical protein RMJ43_05390 [Chloroherpetonaceae bacterium]|nr:hypothetical protein [Chloroherpetonaceae bacterium]
MEDRPVYAFEQHVSVLLQFRAMSAPVEISVPFYVLRYLDTHAERGFTPDGAVIYRQPAAQRWLPELRTRPAA